MPIAAPDEFWREVRSLRHFKYKSLVNLAAFLFALGLTNVLAADIPNEDGNAVRLRQLFWQTNQLDSLRLDIPFDSLSVSASIDDLLSQWHRSGYYYVRATVDSVTLSGSDAALYLSVALGPAVRISSNRIAGLKFTDQKFLNSLLVDNSSQLLTDERLTQAARLAQKIEYVQFIPPILAMPKEGYTEVDLTYNFRERRRVSFFGGLGYIEEGSTGLVWQLSATFRNLLGRGRVLRIDTDRRDIHRQTLNLSYKQPTLWFGRGKFEVDLSSRDYRDQFSEFAIAIGQSSQVGEQAVFAVKTGFKRVEPADSTAGFSRYDLALSLELSNLDQPINPGRGYHLVSSVGYAHRRYSSDSLAVAPEKMVVGESRAKLTIELYQPLFSKIVMLFKAGYLGYESSESQPPLSELYLLGGPGSIRGYRNDRFAVGRAGLFTIEPRLRLESSYLFGFYDALWFARRPLSNDVDSAAKNYYHSYGVGFSIQGGSSQVMLSLGWQPELAIDQPRLSVELKTDL